MAFILSTLSAIVSFYSLLCLISIFMTWIPGVKFTKVGRFISSLCDPYLNLFSRFGWLRIANIDFSPIISIGILSLISSILGRITATGRIYFGGILASVLSMILSVCSSLLTIFALLILIRWIVLIINHGQVSYNSGWYQIDLMLQRFVYKIGNTFVKKNLSYSTALLINWITLFVVIFLMQSIFTILINLCFKIPF